MSVVSLRLSLSLFKWKSDCQTQASEECMFLSQDSAPQQSRNASAVRSEPKSGGVQGLEGKTDAAKAQGNTLLKSPGIGPNTHKHRTNISTLSQESLTYALLFRGQLVEERYKPNWRATPEDLSPSRDLCGAIWICSEPNAKHD